MCVMKEPEAEVARIGSVKPLRHRLSQKRQKKKPSIMKKKESGQHAKVDALFANTAHMETPQLTFANLTFGLRPGKVL